ncbi:PepSY domain-containing protein [Siphonobacter sp. SORGH_AS_1065]|uniref:PepSY-associated TM helix domain-containing protein n=1 Tax=Siphonobacter sp. SORGH_AS_1065 TaxID=3041795 RepID=UPI002788755D|nr:PepSY-associated TM helix domain-containing protein [Siphonobacter sp. SORGH_AS_1065]MDQ1087113.1 putative iron-regulated membrane protein [Siphonobacter sp. SORGH_AS_1065]
MKLNGLGNRTYNIVFHTHTVSGIVISVALYIIFFAGAFTLFRDEFYQWENPSARIPMAKSMDYDGVIHQIKQLHPNFEESKRIRIILPTEEKPLLSILGTLAKPKGQSEFVGFLYNPVTRQLQSTDSPPTTVGETLFRLHYLDQVPYAGRWIAGLVALFFLFASVTGVLIHWRNILTKFYGFSLKGSPKQLWTNAHTVFGLIGLPFQLMYAITGAFYLLLILILVPAVMILYGGDQQKIYGLIRPNETVQLAEKAPVTKGNPSIATIVDKLATDYPGYTATVLEIRNLNRTDALASARLADQTSFTGDGLVAVYMKDGRKAVEVLPGRKTYVQSVVDGIARLHFARFGGLLLKGIYFLLALFTCFVIISGILLWKEARNKKNYTDQQKRFHHRVTMIYLAICLSLFPAVPLLFIAELAVPGQTESHAMQVNAMFFLSWLALALVGLGLKTEARQTRLFLLLGGVFSVLVPVANGLRTGDWLWRSLNEGKPYVFGTDVSWLLIGIATLLIYYATRRAQTAVSSEKNQYETA